MRSFRSQPKTTRLRSHLPWRDILDVLALSAWSAMLFRYWFSGKLLLLLHPDYAWLSNLAAIVLLLLVALTIFRIFKNTSRTAANRTRAVTDPFNVQEARSQGENDQNNNQGHVTLMPPSISSALLLAVAVFGMIYTPRAFASQTAIQRGISDTLTLTRSQPQRFVRPAAPEDRTVIDWIRQVNVYPEPDAYAGQPVEVEGFVIHPEGWPEDMLMVSRFVLTCCAADAYPVGLPVQLTSLGRSTYPVDSWIRVKGEMISDTLDDRRQIVIAPTAIEKIEEPKNPYEY